MEEQTVNIKSLKTLLNNLITTTRYKSINSPSNRFRRHEAFQYECKNSASIVANKSLVVSGILCLHMTNYKLILVDKTDWMYVQLSDSLDSTRVLSSQQQQQQQQQQEPREPQVLLREHLLKPFAIRCFNVVIESLDLQEGESMERKIFYIQADLKFFQPVTNTGDELVKLMSLSERPADLKEGIWTSLTRARKLEEIFIRNSTAASIYAEFSKAARLTKEDLERLGKHIYLFRVVSKESVKMLLNSQHRNKLRGDLIVEIKDLFRGPTNAALLALMSSSLYHYNFLHVNRFYLLISNERVQFQPESNNKSWPSSIIFVGEQFTIIDQQMIVDSVHEYDGYLRELRSVQPAPRTTAVTSPRNNLRNQDYVQSFTGTLLSKELMVNQTNKSQIDPVLDSQLMNHFDVLFSNREFRLHIELEESVLDNIDKFFDSLCGQDQLEETAMCLDKDDSIITVYFDHVFSLFELSVLPGMQVQLSNLIKRSNRVFKSNSTLKSIYSQPFDFLQMPSDGHHQSLPPDVSISYSPLSSPSMPPSSSSSKPPNPFEFLDTADKIFSAFYATEDHRDRRRPLNRPKPRQSFDAVRLRSLFKTTADAGPSSSHAKAFTLTILGQITKFYHLNLRLCCSECARFASSCSCGKRSSFRVELDTSFCVEDHTSWLKCTYTSANYELESKEHSIFAPIAKNLLYLLTNYVNEISLPSVPVSTQFFTSDQQNGEQTSNANPKAHVLNALRAKLQQHQQSESYLKSILSDSSNSFAQHENSLLNTAASTSTSHTNNIAIHINKTIYDYLLHCVIDKYYQFTVAREPGSSTEQIKSPSSNRLLDFRLAKLNDASQQEQYRSMVTTRCLAFTNVNIC